MLRATGKVVRVESKPWAMNENGVSRSGITHSVRLLVGDADFVDIKVPDEGPLTKLPPKGLDLDVAVIVTAPGGRVTCKVVGLWSEVVGGDVKTPVRAAS